MIPVKGLEPPTYKLEVCCSILLSYTDELVNKLRGLQESNLSVTLLDLKERKNEYDIHNYVVTAPWKPHILKAERVGFEPTRDYSPLRISSALPYLSDTFPY